MNDANLIADFIRTVPAHDGGTVVEVCTISWPLPYDPQSTWVAVSVLPAGSSQKGVERAMAKVLRDKRYFRVCQECEERNPVGWMHNTKICQSCAEKHHGVCY